jgi:hypothetical protein
MEIPEFLIRLRKLGRDIQYLLADPDMQDAMRQHVRKHAPRRDGTLQDSVEVKAYDDPPIRIVARATAKHSPWVILGTGIFGPKKEPITSPTGKMLRFEINGRILYRRSVKGQRPNPFIQRALKTLPLVVRRELNRAAARMLTQVGK